MNPTKASIPDAKELQIIINTSADNAKLLHRSLINIYENLRDFWVIKNEENKIIGCVALHIVWEDLAEIRSLVVNDAYKGKGIGKQLVNVCIEEAKKLGLKRIFALTYVPDFFKKVNFSEIEKEKLPHKIWSDCINCVKFPNCNEIALILNL